MKIIDTHCHYNLEPLFSGKKSHFKLTDDSQLLAMVWQDHWQKAQQQSVVGGVVVGASKTSSLSALEIVEDQPQLIAAIGIHPHEAEQHSLAEYEEFLTHLLPNPKVKAIGETGLDYFKLPRNDKFEQTKKAQQQLFELQISLAKKYQLPIIVHVRDDQEEAYWETLTILQQQLDKDLRFVLHCVSGPNNYVQTALEMGGYIGFDGNITYKNANDLRTLFQIVPNDKLLLETDAPYLPPQNYRGQVCEPWMITLTAKYLAEGFATDLDQVFANSEKFFSYHF